MKTRVDPDAWLATLDQKMYLRHAGREVLAMKQSHDALRQKQEYLQNKLIADAWCAAFVWRKVYIASQRLDYPFTHGILREMLDNQHLYREMRQEIERLTEQYLFFHWHLEFPDIFRIPGEGEEPDNPQAGWSGGFDVVLSNPPWERIKLQEKEWFAAYPGIAEAPNAAVRRKRIAALQQSDSDLYNAFMHDQRKAAGESHFIRHAGRYPLCGHGDVNRYAIFAENMRWLVGPKGRVGCIVPSGIATDDTTKRFFRDLMETHTLASLYSFENEEFIFKAVHHATKFCLLTIVGHKKTQHAADFVFFARQTQDLNDDDRHFSLSASDISLFNPNTHTCPIFRSKRDMEITKVIYEQVPVLIKEREELPDINPWKVSFKAMFHMGLCCKNKSHQIR